MDLKVMPKQVSALNTFWLIEYLRQNHPEVDLTNILENIHLKGPYYVENLKTGKVEKLTLDHLLDTQYWVSNRFMIDLYNEIQSRIPDPELAYKMGRTSYKTLPILKTAIAVPLLGPKGLMKRIVKESSKYTRTKDTIVVKNDKGHVIVRLVHYPGIKINRFAMEWTKGVYEAYAKLAGATDVSIGLSCVDEEKVIYDFDIRYKEPTLISRLLRIILFNIPTVKETIEKADEIQMEHKEQILNRDKIIEEKTRELQETQAKLIEMEKRSLEHRITGGFAHEMRNALAGAQLELRSALHYGDEGRPSPEILKDSLTTLVKNVSSIHERYGIPREEITAQMIPELRRIGEVAEHLTGVVAGVSQDLERGLSITNQIREYARLSQLKRGEDEVELIDLLRGYGDRYSRDFSAYGIKYIVEGPERVSIRGDEAQVNSIFSNLVLNAKDALVEIDTQDREIRVSIAIAEQAEARQVNVKVRDNGPGIPEEIRPEIFEPFFSTKPSSGTGLGLAVVKRLVEVYGGRIEFESKANEGTAFTVTLPGVADE